MLEHYFVGYLTDMERRLTLSGLSAYERLMDYWQGWQDRCTLEGHGDGYLVVKLSAEVADLSETMRLTFRDSAERVVLRTLSVVADRGYFKSEQILACHDAGITAYVPKPMTLEPRLTGVSITMPSSMTR